MWTSPVLAQGVLWILFLGVDLSASPSLPYNIPLLSGKPDESARALPTHPSFKEELLLGGRGSISSQGLSGGDLPLTWPVGGLSSSSFPGPMLLLCSQILPAGVCTGRSSCLTNQALHGADCRCTSPVPWGCWYLPTGLTWMVLPPSLVRLQVHIFLIFL